MMKSVKRTIGLILFFCGFAVSVFGQETPILPIDSLSTPADSLLNTVPVDSLTTDSTVIADSVQALPINWLNLSNIISGRRMTDSVVAVSDISTPADVLSKLPGTFLYDTGNYIWPTGVSISGLPSRLTGLTVDGLEWQSLFTQQPLFDLLPFQSFAALTLDPAGGHHTTLQATTRNFAQKRPLTEIRYRAGGDFSGVGVTHSQNRRQNWFGNPVFVHFMFSYGGRGAVGEFDGSNASRRTFNNRFRLTFPSSSLTLSHYYSLNKTGAHAGVINSSNDPDAIYTILGGQTANNKARRRARHNLLTLVYKKRLGNSIFETQLYGRREYFRYASLSVEIDSGHVSALGQRLGFQSSLSVPVGNHFISKIVFDGNWGQDIFQGDSLKSEFWQKRAKLSTINHLNWQNHDFYFSAGGIYQLDTILPFAKASWQYNSTFIDLKADFSYDSNVRPEVLFNEWKNHLRTPVLPPKNSPILAGRLEAKLHLPWNFDLGIAGFASQQNDAWDYFSKSATDTITTTLVLDTVNVVTLTDPIQWVGGTASLSWRKDRPKGFWIHLEATGHLLLNDKTDSFYGRLADSKPQLSALGQIGMRYKIFEGDLDFNLYIQGRFWTATRSRNFYAPLGIFAVPLSSGPILGQEGTVDIYFSAGVRTATIFLSYQNLLAQTVLDAGTQIVSGYPLPQRHLSFGVFWPIFD